MLDTLLGTALTGAAQTYKDLVQSAGEIIQTAGVVLGDLVETANDLANGVGSTVPARAPALGTDGVSSLQSGITGANSDANSATVPLATSLAAIEVSFGPVNLVVSKIYPFNIQFIFGLATWCLGN